MIWHNIVVCTVLEDKSVHMLMDTLVEVPSVEQHKKLPSLMLRSDSRELSGVLVLLVADRSFRQDRVLYEVLHLLLLFHGGMQMPEQMRC